MLLEVGAPPQLNGSLLGMYPYTKHKNRLIPVFWADLLLFSKVFVLFSSVFSAFFVFSQCWQSMVQTQVDPDHGCHRLVQFSVGFSVDNNVIKVWDTGCTLMAWMNKIKLRTRVRFPCKNKNHILDECSRIASWVAWSNGKQTQLHRTPINVETQSLDLYSV